MPSLEFFVVCRSVSRDLFTDDLTLSGILEDVVLDVGGTATLPTAVAVCAWNVGTEDVGQELQAIIKVTRPGESQGKSFPMNLTKGHNRYRALFAVDGIPLATPGELVFEVLLNAEHCASHRVFVHAPGTPPPHSPFSEDTRMESAK